MVGLGFLVLSPSPRHLSLWDIYEHDIP